MNNVYFYRATAKKFSGDNLIDLGTFVTETEGQQAFAEFYTFIQDKLCLCETGTIDITAFNLI